jgi:serine/threonine protein kinase
MSTSTSTCKSNNSKERISECNKVIKQHFKPISTCLDPRNNTLKFENFTISLTSNKVLGMGTFGKIFKDIISINQKSYEVVVKIFANEDNIQIYSEKELQLCDALSNIVLQGISPHFPVIYTTLKCRAPLTIHLESERVITNNYMMFAMEKASGDLFKLLTTNNRINENVMKDILTQVILSIYTFHQYTHCYHNDAHSGNILYSYSNKEQYSYIYYTLSNKNYILNSHGYIMMLWDFGLSEPMLGNSIYHERIKLYTRYEIIRFFGNIQNILGIISDYYYILSRINIFYNFTFITEIKRVLKKYNNIMLAPLKNAIADANIVKQLLTLETSMLNELIKLNLISLENYNAENKVPLLNNVPYILNNINHNVVQIRLSKKAEQYRNQRIQKSKKPFQN